MGSFNFELKERAVGMLCAYAGFMHKTFLWNVKHRFNSLLPTRSPLGYNGNSLNLMTLPEGDINQLKQKHFFFCAADQTGNILWGKVI